MSPKICRRAVFRNSRSAWGGAARDWRGQVTVCIGKPSQFPANCSTHEPGEQFADRVECLVAVTAHELYHLAAHSEPDHRQRTRRRKEFASSERVTCRWEMKCLRAFRHSRELLMTDWSHEPARQAKPVLSIQDKRAAKAQAKLEQWQRKAKLAATKVRQYKKQVAYYDRTLAAKRGAAQ